MSKYIAVPIAFGISIFYLLTIQQLLIASIVGATAIIALKIMWEQDNIKHQIDNTQMWEIYHVSANDDAVDGEYEITETRYLGHIEMDEPDIEYVFMTFKQDKILPHNIDESFFTVVSSDETINILNRDNGKPYYLLHKCKEL